MKRLWVLLLACTLLAQEDEPSFDFFNLSLDELKEISVETASLQAEPLREVPVPVTVITAEMIRKSGARHLADVLVTFVPGMTFSQDHNEINVAMRGIYGSSQQKFLIMVEGHRLNTRAFSQANPDYGIALENIKQIEVLRGPGSSLYGNVALTGVVNIVLLKGADLNGVEASLGTGNFGQRKAALLFGERLGSFDLLAWGHFYKAEGETVAIPAELDFAAPVPSGGEVVVHNFDNSPSHDLGFALKHARFELFAAYRIGKYTPTFTSGGITGRLYDINEYARLGDTGLGLASRSVNLGIKTGWALGEDASLNLHAYADWSRITGGIVLDPDLRSFAYPVWHDRDLGITAQYDRSFSLNGKQGNLLVGTQLDFMTLVDSKLLVGTGHEFQAEAPLMETNDEAIYSGFIQVKQYLTEDLLVNAGFRYDYKERGVVGEVSNLEPRLALVYLPNKGLDIKFSYASSFVDAPYWYRYNQLASYRGGADLKPEYLDSIQLTGTYNWGDNHHQLEANLFYNELSDFVFRDNSVEISDLENPIYKNAGALKSMGLELTYQWVEQRYRINSNATWQKAMDAIDYGETDGHIHNIPSLVANFSLDCKLGAWSGSSSWVNLTVRHLGEQRSPIVVPSQDVALSDYRVDAATLVNAGVLFEEIGQTGLGLDLRAYNLFDESYFQGGSVLFPYPQPGRWLNLKLSYIF